MLNIIILVLSAITAILASEVILVIPLRQLYIHKRLKRNGFSYKEVRKNGLPIVTANTLDVLIKRDMLAEMIELLIAVLLFLILLSISYNNIYELIVFVAFFVITTIIRLAQTYKKLYIYNTLTDLLSYESTVHFLKKKLDKDTNKKCKNIEKRLVKIRELVNKVHSKEDYEDKPEIKSGLQSIGTELLELIAQVEKVSKST